MLAIREKGELDFKEKIHLMIFSVNVMLNALKRIKLSYVSVCVCVCVCAKRKSRDCVDTVFYSNHYFLSFWYSARTKKSELWSSFVQWYPITHSKFLLCNEGSETIKFSFTV